MPVPSTLLAFAVTAASQRDFFQVPLATRQQAFLSPSQPALVTPQAGVMPAYSPAAVLGEPVSLGADFEVKLFVTLYFEIFAFGFSRGPT